MHDAIYFAASYSPSRGQNPAVAIADALNGYQRTFGKRAGVLYACPELAERLQVEPPLKLVARAGINACTVYAGGS